MKFFTKSLIFTSFLFFSHLSFAEGEDWELVRPFFNVDADYFGSDDKRLYLTYSYIDKSSIKGKSEQIRTAKRLLATNFAYISELYMLLEDTFESDTPSVKTFRNFAESQKDLTKKQANKSNVSEIRNLVFSGKIPVGVPAFYENLEIDCNPQNQRGKITSIKAIADGGEDEVSKAKIGIWENFSSKGAREYGLTLGEWYKLNGNFKIWEEVCNNPIEKEK